MMGPDAIILIFCKLSFKSAFSLSSSTFNKRLFNVNWYSQYQRQYGDFFKKLGIKSPYDPAIPLLGIYPEETKIEKDTCTPMFIAALFTIATIWKQPRCLLTDEWIKKLWYIYTMEYYSAIKEHICVISTEVDEPTAYYTVKCQKEKEKSRKII